MELMGFKRDHPLKMGFVRILSDKEARKNNNAVLNGIKLAGHLWSR